MGRPLADLATQNSLFVITFGVGSLCIHARLCRRHFLLLRIASTKQSGVKTDYYFLDEFLVDEKYYALIKEFLKSDGEFELTIKSIDETQVNEQTEDFSIKFIAKKDSFRDRSKNSRQEILKLCIEYFEFLEVQIRNCMAEFN